jgi:ferric-dicitrate binding protein FerR (iron transport regulator)
VRSSLIVLSALASFGTMQAASPLAAASSSSSFEIRGHMLNVAGVPSWPVLEGDTITALDSPVTLLFRDGSRVVLSQNSEARIGSTDQGAVNLLRGAAVFHLSDSASPAFLKNQGSLVSGKTGTIQAGGTTSAAGGLRPLMVSTKPPAPPGSVSAR